jgi:Transposase DDE domain group 1
MPARAQSAYNGRFKSTCYHPLLLFNREGDCPAAKLRPGNVHSAGGWEELLLPEIERQQWLGKEVAFRADAFAKPELYEALEERDVKYAIRLPANDNLQRNITELLTRPVGRPSHKPVVRFKSFLYQAASWTMSGGWWRRWSSIAGNCSRDQSCDFKPGGGALLDNKRGTAEQWIDKARQVLLAAACVESSDAPVVWSMLRRIVALPLPSG